MSVEQQEERIKKWRLILGSKAEPEEGDATSLSKEEKGMDNVLEALYESERKKGLGSTSPNVNRWLGDIRKYFPASVVQVMQKDALERLKLEQMLLEPELLQTIEANVSLVATILSLKKVIPQKTKATAREVVTKVVKALEKKLRNPMREAIQGALSRAVRNRNPKLNEIDWHKTIRANLKHYQPEYNSIIPERLIGYGKKGQALKRVVLLIDQSGSMATSVVYASVFGAIMASIRSLKTQLIVFDTTVVDLTDQLHDPVDLLFGTQLGGGTDIHNAVSYAAELIQQPNDTIFVLISDLYEGGNQQELIKKIGGIIRQGCQFITLLALDDDGTPMYDRGLAATLATMGVPSFGCTPDLFPDLMAAAIKKEDLRQWMGRHGIEQK
ncbi:MAG: VWA domain-containing protein [Bacteroidota bacterium]